MKKTVEVNGYKISYNIDNLITEANHYHFDDECYPKKGECGHGHSLTEIQFNRAKESFVKDIKNLDDTIVRLFEKNAYLTKKGKLAKNRNHKKLQEYV